MVKEILRFLSSVKQVPEGKVKEHDEVCKEVHQTYENKNLKYGDSFGTTYSEYGPITLLIRLEDKLNRVKTLIKNPQLEDVGESIKDSLVDLANYAIMGIIEMELNPPMIKEEVVQPEVKEKSPRKAQEKKPVPTNNTPDEVSKEQLLTLSEKLGIKVSKKMNKQALTKLIMEKDPKALLKVKKG